MNKQLKSKWIKALRSGKYKQGFGRLKQRNDTNHRPEYCCLGVLRELMPVEYQELSSRSALTHLLFNCLFMSIFSNLLCLPPL